MARFQDMPLELVTMIVEQLCYHGEPSHEHQCHCRSIPCNCDPHESSIGSDNATLASLCLTSKLLNDIATKHLYHNPDCETRWPLLARTLIARQDLAQQVQQFETFQADDCREDENGSPVSLMMALCPNLVGIRADINLGDDFVFSHPRTRPNLKKVELVWWDTHSGISFHDLDRLFCAAPNIQAMTMWTVNDEQGGFCEGVTLEKLTHLELKNAMISHDALVALYIMAPNLQTLKYEIGIFVGDEQFGPQELLDATLSHARNLKRLVFKQYHWAKNALIQDDIEFKSQLDSLKTGMKNRGIEFTLNE
ncbi:hypothetical protein B0T21DRAFT_411820 [Apiosordaria backusii]|uniref:Uncharacterized protein n=1 Tax=Apiosordaria backusii TaxID=314023 RepID=A0AA40EHX4_9PEZI|nr:hypothetical protein B0T21DRAFT_411820 [Apiosordaria backusii]